MSHNPDTSNKSDKTKWEARRQAAVLLRGHVLAQGSKPPSPPQSFRARPRNPAVNAAKVSADDLYRDPGENLARRVRSVAAGGEEKKMV